MEITATLDRFEGRFAVLRLPDGQELRWPISALEEALREGSVIRIKLSSAKTEEAEREALARTMLGEILNGAPRT